MNVVIADSHVVCREVIESYIRHADEEMTVYGASDYGELLHVLKQHNSDLILLAPDLPGLSMMDSFADIDRANENMRVGILVRDIESAEGIDTSGTCGTFPKNLPCKDLVEGIKLAINGEFFAPLEQRDSIYDGAISDIRGNKNPDHFHLTQREKEVLSYLTQGAANKDIARALDLQVVTVKLHVRGVCRKMAAKNRTHAALLAKEYGWDF